MATGITGKQMDVIQAAATLKWQSAKLECDRKFPTIADLSRAMRKAESTVYQHLQRAFRKEGQTELVRNPNDDGFDFHRESECYRNVRKRSRLPAERRV